MGSSSGYIKSLTVVFNALKMINLLNAKYGIQFKDILLDVGEKNTQLLGGGSKKKIYVLTSLVWTTIFIYVR